MAIQEDLTHLQKNIDMLFLVLMGTFIFLLKTGFAFFESAFVRSKNCTSVLFRNFFDSTISTIAYFLVGYGLSFGGESNGFCGTKYFALVGVPDDELAHCYFHFTFAACAGTIISGVVHERCTMTAYFCYTALISGIIYPISVHWAVDGGWLHNLGFDDFAYGAVVHALGGAAALAAAVMAGPRKGRFDEDGNHLRIEVHSIPQAVWGLFIFFLGMTAFNAGSQGAISRKGDGQVIIRVVLNMLFSIIGSAATALLYHRFVVNRTPRGWDIENGLNGSLIGMVVVCAGCDSYPYWGAFALGISGYFSFLATRYFVRKAQVDDVLDGVSLHIAGGYWGTLGVSIFKEDGIIMHPSSKTAYGLMINTIGGLAIMAWSFALTFLLYVILRFFHLERVPTDEEDIGLDYAVHLQAAYSAMKAKKFVNIARGDQKSKSAFTISNSALIRNDVPLAVPRRSSADDRDGFVVVHRERTAGAQRQIVPQ